MNILGIDAGRRLGWAQIRPGLDRPLSGHLELDAEQMGLALSSFRDWFLGRLVSGVRHVAWERPYINPDPRKAGKNAELLYGLRAVAQLECYDKRVNFTQVTSSAWRSRFLGLTKAPQVLREEQRRQWWKDRALEECRNRGWEVASEDEAEACGIMDYLWSEQDKAHGSVAGTPLFGGAR